MLDLLTTDPYQSELAKYAQTIDYPFYATSAKENINVQECFQHFIRMRGNKVKNARFTA